MEENIQIELVKDDKPANLVEPKTDEKEQCDEDFFNEFDDERIEE